MKGTLIASILGLVSAAGVWAQPSAGFGAVAGVINQAGGDTMPDATVVLSNALLNTQFTMVTTDDGVFGDAMVVPAEGYHLRVTRKGFQTWQSTAFAVTSGQTLNFTIPLQADGSTVKPVATNDAISPLDVSRMGTSEVISAQQVGLLPASGRRLDALIPVTPTVTTAEAQPGVLVTRDLPFANAVLTDGLDTLDNYFPQQRGIARQYSQDAVQDFQVLASDAPPEFGRAMGSIVNVATPSGTTTYHGSAYEYFRDHSLEAKDAYAAGYDTRQLQHQAGAEAGGPVYGDNIFFFANVEALYRNGDGLNRITNPLIASPTGNSVLASNCTATAAQCAAVTKFIQPQMNVLEPLWEHSANGLAKVDYRRSNRNSFSFDANAMQYHAPSLAQTEDVAPNGGLLGDPTLREQTRFVKIGWTGTVSPVTVNELSIGGYQDRISEYANKPGLSTGLLGITVAGTTIGATQQSTAILPSDHRVQLVDNFHRTLASHLFQVGVDASETHYFVNSLAYPAGAYTYPSLTSFAADFSAATTKNYTVFNQSFGNEYTGATFRTKELNAYGQDTWRASPRLTIEYGIRYERPLLPQPGVVNTSFYETASIASPWLNLAGRGGFAYMVNSRTVLRASFGMFYAPFPDQLIGDLFIGNGLYQPNISVNPYQTNATAFPNTFASISKIPTSSENVVFASTKLRNPDTQDTNLSIERRLWKDSTLSIGGIHTRGFALWTIEDQNLAPSSITETYNIQNAAGQVVNTFLTNYYNSRDFTTAAHAYLVENGGSFFYNALMAQLRMRVSHGLSLWGSYTWSHAIDDLGPTSALGFALLEGTTPDPNSDRGRAALDQRQRAVVRWTWEPTVSAGVFPAARRVLNGWALSGVATLASGQGATPLVMVQGQQFSGVTMVYTNSLNGSGGWNRVPFEPVNSLNLGSQYTIDAHLGRTFSFTERIKGTVAFEAFNLLNRQFPTLVNTIAYLSVSPLKPGLVNGPTTGILKPVPSVGAGIASQGFPDGTNARRCQIVFRLSF